MRIGLALIAVLSLGFAAPPAPAASPAELDALHDALRNEDLLAILREEGIVDAARVREDMFPGRGGQVWDVRVEGIYAPDRLSATFRGAFAATLADADVAPLIAFFRAEPGRSVIRLEVEGRRAIMAEAVEDAARRAFAQVEEAGGARLGLLRDLAEDNDLVGRNVAGAMNASLAFYQGLADGGGFDLDTSGVMADIWGREAEIREETEGWVYAYMAMAYAPLADADLARYVALMASPEGRVLNAALFAGFEEVFREVSYGVGHLASSFADGEDL